MKITFKHHQTPVATIQKDKHHSRMSAFFFLACKEYFYHTMNTHTHQMQPNRRLVSKRCKGSRKCAAYSTYSGEAVAQKLHRRLHGSTHDTRYHDTQITETTPRKKINGEVHVKAMRYAFRVVLDHGAIGKFTLSRPKPEIPATECNACIRCRRQLRCLSFGETFMEDALHLLTPPSSL